MCLLCNVGKNGCLSAHCAAKCCVNNYAYTQEGKSYKTASAFSSPDEQRSSTSPLVSYSLYTGSALLLAAVVVVAAVALHRVSMLNEPLLYCVPITRFDCINDTLTAAPPTFYQRRQKSERSVPHSKYDDSPIVSEANYVRSADDEYSVSSNPNIASKETYVRSV
jgi:hypothetical protein